MFLSQWLLNVPIYIIIILYLYKTRPWLDDDWLKYDSLSTIAISRNPRETKTNDWMRCVCFAWVGLFAVMVGKLYILVTKPLVNYQPLGSDFCALLGDRSTGTCSTTGIKCLTSGSTCTYSTYTHCRFRYADPHPPLLNCHSNWIYHGERFAG